MKKCDALFPVGSEVEASAGKGIYRRQFPYTATHSVDLHEFLAISGLVHLYKVCRFGNIKKHKCLCALLRVKQT